MLRLKELSFLKAADESFGLKAWFGINDVSNDGGVNNQLLSFSTDLTSGKMLI